MLSRLLSTPSRVLPRTTARILGGIQAVPLLADVIQNLPPLAGMVRIVCCNPNQRAAVEAAMAEQGVEPELVRIVARPELDTHEAYTWQKPA